MDKKPFSIVLSILTILAIALPYTTLAYSGALLMGNIQFPQSVQTTPNVRIYYQGVKIPCEVDHELKRTLFNVAKSKYTKQFHLLITEEFTFESEKNVIKFLKVDSEKTYKLYRLTLKKEQAQNSSRGTLTSGTRTTSQASIKHSYGWNIEKTNLNELGRIPDDTIIVRYNPEYVEELKGGSAVEFPKVIIKENILKLVGSERNLHEHSARLLLASLDQDMIHAKLKLKTQGYHNKTILALVS